MADKNAQVGNPDFDWNSIGKKNSNYSSDERTKLDEMYGKSLSTIADAQTMQGTVVAKNAREVVVNIGYKSDGVVALSEFRYNPDLKIGDSVAKLIEKAEDNYGAYVPDLPGCVATGDTPEETEALLREAIEIHLEGMREDGIEPPKPTSEVRYLEVAA